MSKLYHPSPTEPAPKAFRYFCPASSTESCSPGTVNTCGVLQAAHHLLHLVELAGAGQVREVAGVDDEIRCVAQVVDLIDRVAERAGHVRVGRTGEADVAVADLSEPQGGPGTRVLGRRGAGDM